MEVSNGVKTKENTELVFTHTHTHPLLVWNNTAVSWDLYRLSVIRKQELAPPRTNHNCIIWEPFHHCLRLQHTHSTIQKLTHPLDGCIQCLTVGVEHTLKHWPIRNSNISTDKILNKFLWRSTIKRFSHLRFRMHSHLGKSSVLKDCVILYRQGVEGAQQCYYLNSVSSPTHTSAMLLNSQQTPNDDAIQPPHCTLIP